MTGSEHESQDASTLAEAAERAVAMARQARLTLVTVESCTAGGLARALSRQAGAGEVLHGGFVVYSKPQKVVLGVDATLLARCSAVSAEVAQAMARRGLDGSPADVALAVTGVTGPAPDEDGNPVGRVHLAVARRDGQMRHAQLDLAGDPDAVAEQAMVAVLGLARPLLRC